MNSFLQGIKSGSFFEERRRVLSVEMNVPDIVKFFSRFSIPYPAPGSKEFYALCYTSILLIVPQELDDNEWETGVRARALAWLWGNRRNDQSKNQNDLPSGASSVTWNLKEQTYTVFGVIYKVPEALLRKAS